MMFGVWFLNMHTRMGCRACHCVHPATSFLCALVLAIYKFAYQSLPASKSPSNKVSLYQSSILRCPFWTSYAKKPSIYSFTFFVPRDSSTEKKKKALNVVFILTYILLISCFSFSLHSPFAPCWFGIHPSLKFSPFCLFLFFEWGNKEGYVDLEVVEKMSPLCLGCCPFSVIPKLGTTHFCSPFQNGLFIPITDRDLMENISKFPLATPSWRLYEYLFHKDK